MWRPRSETRDGVTVSQGERDYRLARRHAAGKVLFLHIITGTSVKVLSRTSIAAAPVIPRSQAA